MIHEDSLVTVTSEQVACEMQEELLILQTGSGIYYGLDPMGKRVRSMMIEPQRVADIRDTLLDEFDVDRETCTRDLLAFLEEMARKQIIEVRPAPVD